MFTGITTAVGSVRRMARRGKGALLEIDSAMGLDDVLIGDSVAVSGACLTVTAKTGASFAADVSEETLSRTTLGGMKAGDMVNLEKALRIGDRLGGHIVLGHVDGTGRIIEKSPRAGSMLFGFEIDPVLGRYVVAKGSVTVDGVSLTVNRCEKNRFYVNIIPHTASETTLGRKQPGDLVNIETDIIARYLEKLISADRDNGELTGGVDMETLARYGFLK